MDIKFEHDGMSFNVRCSCIVKDASGENVLLTHMRAIKGAFMLPGGRAEVLENTEEAVKRELLEELGLELDCKLISVQENIVRETKFHMIEFVFFSVIESFDFISLNDGWDKFKIVKLKDIESSDIRPKPVKALILLDKYDTITHNVNYDWGCL